MLAGAGVRKENSAVDFEHDLDSSPLLDTSNPPKIAGRRPSAFKDARAAAGTSKLSNADKDKESEGKLKDSNSKPAGA